MFDEINTILFERSDEISSLVSIITYYEDYFIKNNKVPAPLRNEDDFQAQKGLLFVYLYGLGECIYKKAMLEVLAALHATKTPIKDYKASLLSLVMSKDFDMLQEGTERQKHWKKRIEFSKRFISNEVPEINLKATVFVDGNIKIEHFLDFANTFDIEINDMFPNSDQFRGRWDTIVSHRQQISHGGEKASKIGGKVSAAELEVYYDTTKKFMIHFLNLLNEYFKDQKYVR